MRGKRRGQVDGGGGGIAERGEEGDGGEESLKYFLFVFLLAFCYDPVFIIHPICLEKG